MPWGLHLATVFVCARTADKIGQRDAKSLCDLVKRHEVNRLVMGTLYFVDGVAMQAGQIRQRKLAHTLGLPALTDPFSNAVQIHVNYNTSNCTNLSTKMRF